MKVYKSSILVPLLFLSFFSHAMQFTDLHDDCISKLIWHFESSSKKTISNEDNNENTLADEQQNALKHFYKNIVWFSYVNKGIHKIIQTCFFDKNANSFPFHQEMITLHKEKKLHLFTYPCLKNSTEYHCIGTIHFSTQTIYNLDEKNNDYEFILSIYRYDMCVKIEEMMDKMHNAWDINTLDKDLFQSCINYTNCKITKEKINAWIDVFDNQTSTPRTGGITVNVLPSQNLYIWPRYCSSIKSCTYELFSQFLTLKYSDPIEI